MKQTIYMAIDDSGNLLQDKIMTFGGIIFFNSNELNNFTKEYQNIVAIYKPRYKRLLKRKPAIELKSCNLKKKHFQVFMNYLSKYELMSIGIDTTKIYKNILKNKKSKGRYLDYAIKIMIKNTIKDLIKINKLDQNKELELIIYVDQSSYKSNGLYNLEKSIYQELKYGMTNIRKNSKFKNLINNKLTIRVIFKNSLLSYPVQAADLIAGYARKSIVNKNDNNLKTINHLFYLPK